MKRFLLWGCLFGVVGLACVCLDWVAGLEGEVGMRRRAALLFRQEARPLKIDTRTLVRGVEHRYEVPGDDGVSGARLFRTGRYGTVLGPEGEAGGDGVRILFLGGSTTETNEVEEEARFPYLVGERLTADLGSPVYGVNLGVRGNTVHDSINLLNNHPAAALASIVVLMHNINDRLYLAKWGRYVSELGPAGHVGLSEVRRGVQHLAAVVWEYLSLRSNLLFRLRYMNPVSDPWGRSGSSVVDERAIDFADAEFERSRREFTGALHVFVATARARGKRVVLMTQALGRGSAEQAGFNSVIRQVAQETQATLIDLDHELPEGREWFFFADNIHLNDEGSRAVADVVARGVARGVFGAEPREEPSPGFTRKIDLGLCRQPRTTRAKMEPGKSRELLPVTGRYPVFSADERWIIFQTLREGREVVRAHDTMTGRYTGVSNPGAHVVDRHAVPLAEVGEEDAVAVVFGRSEGGLERLHKGLIGGKGTRVVEIEMDARLSGAIPAAAADGDLYFAGSSVGSDGGLVEAPNLYRMELATGELVQLTRTKWEEWRPAPSPTDDVVFHIANPAGQFDLFKFDESEEVTTLVFGSPQDEWDPDVSPDGRWLVFASRRSGNWDLYALDIDRGPGATPVQLTDTPGDEWDPRFLPKSPVIAFASSERGAPPRLRYLCPFGEKEMRDGDV